MMIIIKKKSFSFFSVNTKVVTFITIILLFPNQFVIKWQGFFWVVNNEFIFYLDLYYDYTLESVDVFFFIMMKEEVMGNLFNIHCVHFSRFYMDERVFVFSLVES